MDEHDHASQSFGYSNLLDDDDSGIVMRTNSQTSLDKSRQEYGRTDTSASSFNTSSSVAPPKPLPRKSVSPHVTAMEDRLITGGSSQERPRPRPIPRKRSMDGGHEQTGDLLISLESPTKESESFGFENLKGSGDYVVLREPKTVQRSEPRRSSISRTPAMKLAQSETPKRPNVRRDQSPVSPEEELNKSQPASLLDFDPLSGQVEQKQSAPKPNSDNSESLLKDWEIKNLAPMNLSSNVAPSVSNVAPNMYNYGHPTPPPRHTTSQINKPTFYTPQNYGSNVANSNVGHGMPKVLNFDNPLAQTKSPPAPQVPPRPKDRPYSAVFPGYTPEQPANKQDPFADLVSLNQPSPAPRSFNKPARSTPPPRLPKNNWETFD